MTQEDIDNPTTIGPGSAWEYPSLPDEIIKRIVIIIAFLARRWLQGLPATDLWCDKQPIPR